MSLLLKTVVLVFFSLAFLYSFQPAFAVCSSAGANCTGAADYCPQGAAFLDPSHSTPAEPECALYTCVNNVCVAPGGAAPGGATTPAAGTGEKPLGGKGETCQYDLYTQGINTALGCVPTEPSAFILAVSRLLSGAGGGIALLLMIAGSFRMITSGGNPDAIKAGSEQFTSALIGLLFIIFAVLLLKVIGVDILNLPNFLQTS